MEKKLLTSALVTFCCVAVVAQEAVFHRAVNKAVTGRNYKDVKDEAIAKNITGPSTKKKAPVTITNEMEKDAATNLFLEPKNFAPIIAAPPATETPFVASEVLKEKKIHYITREKGIAVWLDNNRSENVRNNFALHKTAPIGSLVKVRNPMNGRTAYVKIVGRLSNDISNQNVVIKLSKGAIRQLNVLDEKFLAEVMVVKN